jgi:hypothetical protein
MIMLRDICWFGISIPDVVWSGIIASVITLSGVFASNYSNNKRLQIQLSHDAREKERDRLLSLRREIYVGAAKKMTRAAAHFARMSTLDPATTDLSDGLMGIVGATAQIMTICEPDTHKIMSALSTEYANTFFRLMARAKTCHELKREFEREDNETRKKELEDLHMKAIIEYGTSVHSEMTAMANLQLEASIALRRELGLDTDISEAFEQSNEVREKMQKGLTDFMEKLDG